MNQNPKEEKNAKLQKSEWYSNEGPHGMVQIFLWLPIFSISNSHLYRCCCCCRCAVSRFKTINPHRFQNCCIAITYELVRWFNHSQLTMFTFVIASMFKLMLNLVFFLVTHMWMQTKHTHTSEYHLKRKNAQIFIYLCVYLNR